MSLSLIAAAYLIEDDDDGQFCESEVGFVEEESDPVPVDKTEDKQPIKSDVALKVAEKVKVHDSNSKVGEEKKDEVSGNKKTEIVKTFEGPNGKAIKEKGDSRSKRDIRTPKDIPPKSTEKPFKCPFCFKLCLTSDDLIDHLPTHIRRKSKTGRVSSDQQSHNDSGIPDASSDSGNGSEDESARRSKETGRWSCVIGGATFWRSYDLDHINENRFKCPLCPKGFSQLSLIEAHISEVHGGGRTRLHLLESSKSKKINVEATTKSVGEDGRVLRPCQIILNRCDYMMKTNPMKESTVCVHNSSDKSKTERSLYSRNHTASEGAMRRTSSGYQPVICNNKSANDISNFKSSEERFSCTKCPKSYRHSRSLRDHMNSHGNAHRCPHCNKGFNCQSRLSRHLPVHQKPKPSTVPEGCTLCPYCYKLFTDSSAFNEHLKLHRREAPYKCSICSKFCTTKKNLAIHKYRHQSKKSSYECNHCSKKFKTKSGLSRHLVIHTGSKPYECPRCPKKFSRNQVLKRHLLRHDGIKSFGCPVCMKTFVDRNDLIQHKIVHSDATPYKCSECPARFKRLPGLKKHKNVHRIPNTNIPKIMEESIPPTE